MLARYILKQNSPSALEDALKIIKAYVLPAAEVYVWKVADLIEKGKVRIGFQKARVLQRRNGCPCGGEHSADSTPVIPFLNHQQWKCSRWTRSRLEAFNVRVLISLCTVRVEHTVILGCAYREKMSSIY